MQLFGFFGRGANTAANSSTITIATDDAQIGTKVTAVPALGAGGTGIIGWLSNIVSKFTSNGYPGGSTAVSAASGNVANAAAVATLPATAAVTNYVTGVRVSGLGATAGGGAGLTLSGIQGGSYIHYFNVPAGVGVAFMFDLEFPYPIPASAVNTAIVATVGALGAGNTNCNVSISGFRI